jgi:ABC-2 type transport system permease protein
MKNMWFIARKELKSYFGSPVAYVVCFVIVLTLGFIFWYDINYAVQTQQYVPNVQETFQLFVFPLLFLAAPAITMRTMAEEHRMGTLELLLTSPVKDWELIVGKWLGSFLLFTCITAITIVYPLILNSIVQPGIDQGIILTSYLGLLLMIASMCALGVFISSIFNNQIAALFASIGLMLLFWIINYPAQSMVGAGADILNYLSLPSHFYNTFLNGVIDLQDVIFYLSLTALGLFLGTVTIDVRRWR